MTSNTDPKKWYAIRVAHSREAVVKSYLDNRQIENFIPAYCETDVLSDMEGGRCIPVIPGLIFVHTVPSRLQEIKTLGRHTVQYLLDRQSHLPVVIPEKQIRDFVAVLDAANGRNRITGPESVRSVQGERVRVEGGEFAGIEGICIRQDGACRIAVVIDPIATVLTAPVPASYLKKTDEEAVHTTIPE